MNLSQIFIEDNIRCDICLSEEELLDNLFYIYKFDEIEEQYNLYDSPTRMSSIKAAGLETSDWLQTRKFSASKWNNARIRKIGKLKHISKATRTMNAN